MNQIELLVGSMHELEQAVGAACCHEFLVVLWSLLEIEYGIPDPTTVVSAFLDAVIRSSDDLNPPPSLSKSANCGPAVICSAGVPKVCAAPEWKGIEKSLGGVVNKLIECKDFHNAVLLVHELSALHVDQVDGASLQHTICAKLANQVIGPAFLDAMKKPSLQVLLDMLSLSEVFCPLHLELFSHELLALNVDATVAPPALALQKEQTCAEQQAMISIVASHCIQVITTRLQEPMGVVVNRSLSLSVNSQIETQRINDFLRGPRRESLSFELTLHSHEKLLTDLKPLVGSGLIKAYPSRPSGVGRWSIKIDKLQSQVKPVTSILSMSRTCWPSQAATCIIASSKAKQPRETRTSPSLSAF